MPKYDLFIYLFIPLTLYQMRLEYEGLIWKDSNGDHFNRNSMHWPIVEACLIAGHYPNVENMSLMNRTMPHISSALCDPLTKKLSFSAGWVIFSDKIHSRSYTFLKDITCVSPVNVALFAKKELVEMKGSDCELVDELCSKFSVMFERFLQCSLHSRFIMNRKENELMNIICEVIKREHIV